MLTDNQSPGKGVGGGQEKNKSKEEPWWTSCPYLP